jgi:PAP2 superfamily
MLRLIAATIVMGLAILPAAAQAGQTERDVAEQVSGPGTLLFLAAGVALPLLRGGADAMAMASGDGTDSLDGSEQALRGADSLIAAVLTSEGLKRVVDAKRPDGSGERSFPSTHATAAFSVATLEAELHPDEALLWYGGASLIAASRVTLNKHRISEVLAGAALGWGMTKLELRQKHGLILQPLIGADGDAGMLLLKRW